jgi:tellurite resistance protein
MKSSFIAIPVSYFGMVLGLAGLGNGWRTASSLWHLPALPDGLIIATAGAVWLALMAAYAAKRLFARSQALAEFRHPIQCCFIGLVPVSTMLIALAAAPYTAKAASILFAAGAVAQFLFAIHRSGALWMGGREETDTTPAAYLPVVAGNFVTAMGSATLGFATLATLFFGAGVFSWLALESVVFWIRFVSRASGGAPSPLDRSPDLQRILLGCHLWDNGAGRFGAQVYAKRHCGTV